MSLALCPQVVSQAPQHFRSSVTRVSCVGRFARQSICWVFSLDSGMSRTVHRHEFSKVAVEQDSSVGNKKCNWRGNINSGTHFLMFLKQWIPFWRQCNLIWCSNRYYIIFLSLSFSSSRDSSENPVFGYTLRCRKGPQKNRSIEEASLTLYKLQSLQRSRLSQLNMYKNPINENNYVGVCILMCDNHATAWTWSDNNLPGKKEIKK